MQEGFLATVEGSGQARTRRRYLPLIPLLVVSCAAAVILIGVVPWETATFSGQIVTAPPNCEYGCSEILHTVTIPAGSSVSLHWSDMSGGRVTFVLQEPSPGNSTVSQCTWFNQVGGSCTFTSVGGPYTIAARNFVGTLASQTVNYGGTYLSSLL